MRHFLDFEKPIAELEGKIEELRHLTGEHGLNIADEVSKLQAKVNRQIRAAYAKLTPWQKVQVARHPERPHFSDYAKALYWYFGLNCLWLEASDFEARLLGILAEAGFDADRLGLQI